MIKYNLKLTHIENSTEVKSYLEDRLSQISKFIHGNFENISSEIEIGKTTEHHKHGDIFKSEINLRLEDGTFLRADATAGDIFSAIDLTKSKIIKEVKRHYGREQSLLKKGGRAIKRLFRG